MCRVVFWVLFFVLVVFLGFFWVVVICICWVGGLLLYVLLYILWLWREQYNKSKIYTCRRMTSVLEA